MSQPTIAARPEPTRSEAQLRIDPAILYWGTPVVLISTANENGTANLAPMSSAWWLGWGCMLGLTESSHSVTNLRRTGDCVLNLPSVEQVAAVDRIARTTGADPVPIDKQWLGFEHEGHKFDRAGLTAVASDMVTHPERRNARCRWSARWSPSGPSGPATLASQPLSSASSCASSPSTATTTSSKTAIPPRSTPIAGDRSS